MKKLCFVFEINTNARPVLNLLPWIYMNGEELAEHLSGKYEVMFDYFKNKDRADYLVVPNPNGGFINETDLPEIPVDLELFFNKDFQGIEASIDNFFNEKQR
ncbi:hypothetical protein [Enterococcus sp. AZ109]|uniref:hypothetical protein n=1 Tax=Enterococcus sp. AZ109 TaxID=2774634 RepID=UPI003F1F53BB